MSQFLQVPEDERGRGKGTSFNVSDQEIFVLSLGPAATWVPWASSTTMLVLLLPRDDHQLEKANLGCVFSAVFKASVSTSSVLSSRRTRIPSHESSAIT